MKRKSILISVKKPDKFKIGQVKTCLSQTVELDDSISFDYCLIEKALNVLFPGSFIDFTVRYDE